MRIFEECPKCGEVIELEIDPPLFGDPARAFIEDRACGCELPNEWEGEILSEVDLEDLWYEEMGWI